MSSFLFSSRIALFLVLVCSSFHLFSSPLDLSLTLSPPLPLSYVFSLYIHSQRRNTITTTTITITNHQVVGEDDAAPEDKVLGASDFDHLAASIHRKIHQKRTLARLPLVLSQPSSSDATSGSGSDSSGEKGGGAADMPTVSIQMKLVRKCCQPLSISLSRSHLCPI